MNNEEFRAKVLAILGLTVAPKAEQDAFLYKVESIAQKRLSQLLPNLMTDDQIQQAEAMQASGAEPTEVMAWIERQVPHYEELLRSAVLDVAEEAAR